MKFAIHQVRLEDDAERVAFMPLSFVKMVHAYRYAKVYEGETNIAVETDDKVVLEGLFHRFNCDHPADYRARSLSVSDVVVLDDARIYFCDSVGWRLLNAETVVGAFT